MQYLRKKFIAGLQLYVKYSQKFLSQLNVRYSFRYIIRDNFDMDIIFMWRALLLQLRTKNHRIAYVRIINFLFCMFAFMDHRLIYVFVGN